VAVRLGFGEQRFQPFLRFYLAGLWQLDLDLENKGFNPS